MKTEEIVDSYRFADLGDDIIDFLPLIFRKKPEDLEALEGWKDHFVECDIPWAVTAERTWENRKIYKLWIPRTI